MTNLIDLVDHRRRNKRQKVKFDRAEFRALMDMYSRRVASGEWKDYALDQHGPIAVFSIFRHSYEMPAFAVVKTRNGKNDEYMVMSSKRILKRAGSLADALQLFEKPLHLVSR